MNTAPPLASTARIPTTARTMPRICTGMALLGESFLADWSVRVSRRSSGDSNAAEDTARLISQSGSAEQRGERLIRVIVAYSPLVRSTRWLVPS